jgi:APA family basic amino acid/polyamine antiporter
MPEPAEFGLIRSIRRWDFSAVTINALIRRRPFRSAVESLWPCWRVQRAAFLLCAVFAAIIVLCFAEVGSRFSETGAPYLYTREAFGPAAGFTIGWLM